MADYTEAQLAALRKAYASGTLRLTYEGKTIEYRSLEEMERSINTIARSLAKDSGVKRSRQVHLRSRRGL